MFLVFVLIFSQLIRIPAKPQLIVHIGPSKTASTTIQNAINDHRRRVTAAGWLPLGTDHNLFHQRSDVDRAFRDYNDKREGNFFQAALDESQNVIISCEYLGSVQATGMEFYNPVLEAFDTTVVMFYRDFLSIEISLHYQRRTPDSLLQFITDPQELRTGPVIIGTGGYFERMDAWNRFEKMIVLDYNGMVAKEASFQYAMFCNVLAIQEMCDDEALKKENHVANPTTTSRIDELRIARVAELFHSFARTRGCQADFESFKKEIDLSDVPLHKLDLSHLAQYSKLLDRAFRSQYEVTLFSDPEATLTAIESHVNYEDIDVQAMLLDEGWHRKFEDELKFQRDAGKAKCGQHPKHESPHSTTSGATHQLRQ